MAHIGDEGRHSLLELVASGPVLTVFLRHLGCVFCRQTLADLRDARREIEEAGLRIALVHMASDRQADLIFRLYSLGDVHRFSDPDRSLYQSFGLRRATMREIFRTDLVKRGIEACVRERHSMGVPRGDPMQLPGAFLVEQGHVLASFVCDHAWDRLDFRAFARAARAPALFAS